jgi:hypothetical protein
VAATHPAIGHDSKAIKVLERSLSIDPTFPLGIALLCLAYLLLYERGAKKILGEEKSVLWNIDPVLAQLP